MVRLPSLLMETFLVLMSNKILRSLKSSS